MRLRLFMVGLVMVFSLLATLDAHEAHRNNEPDPVVSINSANAGQSEQATKIAQIVSDQPGEHAHSNNADNGFDLIDFLGRLHPAAVHFPIALFLVAALAELIMVFNPTAGVGSSVRFLVWTGAAGGIVAASLGWLAGGMRMSDRSEILGLHRWTGTGIAMTGLAVALLSGAAVGSPKRTAFRIILGAIAIAILIQGYWGAELSLGPDHMGLHHLGI